MILLQELLSRFRALGITGAEWSAESGISHSIIMKISSGDRDNILLLTFEKLLLAVQRFEMGENKTIPWRKK
jgi:predicted transcriptional regulator